MKSLAWLQGSNSNLIPFLLLRIKLDSCKCIHALGVAGKSRNSVYFRTFIGFVSFRAQARKIFVLNTAEQILGNGQTVDGVCYKSIKEILKFPCFLSRTRSELHLNDKLNTCDILRLRSLMLKVRKL